MSGTPRPRASFGEEKKDVPGVLSRAHIMYNGLTTNVAMFASPTIALAAFLALITALVVAQQNATGTKAKGLATLRNTKRDALWTAMESLRAYVQGLADVLPADGAIALIEAAGLVVAATAVHHKAALAARLTTTPGVVHLDVNASLLAGPTAASKKKTCNWQWSGDAGKTWNDVRSTPYANTDVPGLALMGTYSFRASVTVGKEIGAWTQPVSLLVH